MTLPFSGWALLTCNRWTASVRVPDRVAESRSPHFLDVLPGFFETMRIGLIHGRDFRAGDLQPQMKENGNAVAGVGIVNEAFAGT